MYVVDVVNYTFVYFSEFYAIYIFPHLLSSKFFKHV